MKKIFVVFLALALMLTACAVPGAQAPQPVVVNITVVAPAAAATDVPAPTAVPATDVPAPTDVPATAVPAPTDVPATAVPPTAAPAEPTSTTAAAAVAPSATPQPAVGGAVFINITRSADAFSLKCSPSEILFKATSNSTYITAAVFYYRMVDKVTNSSSSWNSAGNMEADGAGNYSYNFSALNITPDLRYANGWFEYQLVGLNKGGNVVGRTEKFTKLVTFTLDCP